MVFRGRIILTLIIWPSLLHHFEDVSLNKYLHWGWIICVHVTEIVYAKNKNLIHPYLVYHSIQLHKEWQKQIFYNIYTLSKDWRGTKTVLTNSSTLFVLTGPVWISLTSCANSCWLVCTSWRGHTEWSGIHMQFTQFSLYNRDNISLIKVKLSSDQAADSIFTCLTGRWVTHPEAPQSFEMEQHRLLTWNLLMFDLHHFPTETFCTCWSRTNSD